MGETEERIQCRRSRDRAAELVTEERRPVWEDVAVRLRVQQEGERQQLTWLLP